MRIVLSTSSLTVYPARPPNKQTNNPFRVSCVLYLAILQIIRDRDSGSGQFAFLSDQDETNTQPLGEQRPKQETTSI